MRREGAAGSPDALGLGRPGFSSTAEASKIAFSWSPVQMARSAYPLFLTYLEAVGLAQPHPRMGSHEGHFRGHSVLSATGVIRGSVIV